MSRDEWPMLAVSVAHSLLHHAETALVVDDGSRDETPSGVAQLQAAFPDRVRYLRLDDMPYIQAAVSAIVVDALRGDPAADWVYFVDADEFGVGRRLDEELAQLADEVMCARYEVHNFVAPSDFDSHRPSDYRRVRHRARAFSLLDLPGRLLGDQVEHGDATFFDAPFGHKFVVRRGAGGFLTAGSRRITAGSAEAVELASSEFFCAHLPFTGVDRLLVRANHGDRLIEAADDSDHGWQSRMVARMAAEGRLDELWARHSMGETKGPEVIDDDALAEAVGTTLDELALRGVDISRAPLVGRPQSLEFGPLATSMRVIRDLLAHHDLDEQIKAELTLVRREAELRGTLLDESAYEIARIRLDRASLLAERTRLIETIGEMRSSRTWRVGRVVTAPFAWLARRRH